MELKTLTLNGTTYDSFPFKLTEADKQEIAEQAAGLVEIPNGGGFVASDTPPEDTSVLWVDTNDNEGDEPPAGSYVLTEADKQEIAEQAAQLVEVPEGGSGLAKTQKLLDITFTEAIASVSVTLEHDFHRLLLVWGGGENARIVDADGNVVNNGMMNILLDTTSTGWNDRKICIISDNGKPWLTTAAIMEWTDDCSTLIRSHIQDISTNRSAAYPSMTFGGVSAMIGTVGSSSALAPTNGVTVHIVAGNGFYAPNTRIVLVGEYYE